MRGSVLAAVLLAGFVQGAAAEDPETGVNTADPPASSPVLTLDQEKLFANSLFGQRVAQEIETASKALAAENRDIEAKLAAEEQDLTRRRPTLPAEEFRVLADAFDARVVEHRRVQEEKLVALNRLRDDGKRQFYQAALPVLATLVTETGAEVILDSRSVFLALDRIDITDAALERIDRTVGAGTPGTPGPASGD